MARVVLEALTKDFLSPTSEITSAVRQSNLTIADGELLAVVGPSGCGKTTLLRLIAGLEEPTHGLIQFDGRDVTGVSPQDRDVAMVFQHHALYPHLTVRENLSLGLRLRRCPKIEIEQRVTEAAALLGLENLMERLPQALSGGERQRVAIGRAVVRRPRVFLCDEPLASLDAPLRAQLREEIVTLQQRLRTTMVYVTHDQTEALAIGQRVAVMNRGRIEQCADPRTLYQHPANLFVAGFIGSPPLNLVPGTLVETGGALAFRAEGLDWTCRIDPSRVEKLRPHLGQALVLGMRPEHLKVIAHADKHGPLAGLTAILAAVETTGPETILRLTTTGPTLSARVREGAEWKAGEAVRVSFDLERGTVFDAGSRARLD